MCPSASRVCSEPGGQKPVLSLSLDRIWNVISRSQGVNPRLQWLSARPQYLQCVNDGDVLQSCTKKSICCRELLTGNYSVVYALSSHIVHIFNAQEHVLGQSPIPITLSKAALLEDAFFAVAILGGGWLQSPASDGAPWNSFPWISTRNLEK